MDITVTLPMLVGIVPATITIPLLVQHLKHLVRWVGSRGRRGSAYPALAVVAGVAYTHALHQAALLTAQVDEASLNGWAVTLIGLTVGAIAPLGYDGWKRYRPGAASGG